MMTFLIAEGSLYIFGFTGRNIQMYYMKKVQQIALDDNASIKDFIAQTFG